MTGDTARIGYLRDVYAPGRHDFGGNGLQMTIDEANASGRLCGRRIELVTRTVERGAGTHDNVAAACAAWDELVHGEDVLGLIGPSTTPVALAVVERVERAQVPAIHWAGTDAACSPWQFQYQAGHFPQEGPALAFLLSRLGHRRVACFRSEGAYGKAYLQPFITAAEAAGLEIACEMVVPLETSEVAGFVEQAMRHDVDAVVAMGLFGLGVPLAREITARAWPVACFGNCGFAIYAGGDRAAAEALEGWTAVDLFDPGNPVTCDFLDRYERAFGPRPNSASACFARDLGALIGEAVRLAPELSRAGLRVGLEAVRDLPAAAGGPGTTMGFGADDRLALKGPRIFLFNRISASGLVPIAG